MRAGRDAQHEVLASSFWAGLRRCLAAAQAELAGQEADSLPARVSGAGSMQAAVQDGCIPGLSTAKRSGDEQIKPGRSTPGATMDCDYVSSGDGGSTGDAAISGRLRPAPDGPASMRQPQEALSLSASTVADSTPEHRLPDDVEAVSNSRPRAEQQAPAVHTVSDSKPADSPAALHTWADVQQLIVYGLGSLESGACLQFWTPAPCQVWSSLEQLAYDGFKAGLSWPTVSDAIDLLRGKWVRCCSLHNNCGVVPSCHVYCTGPVPRHQTALALALEALLPGLTGPVRAYDPVFTAVDTDALKLLQIEVRRQMPAYQ